MIKVLSLHLTSKCNMNPRCPFCYSKPREDKPLKWFLDVPKVAAELGVEQMPIGGGEVLSLDGKGLRIVNKLLKECEEYSIIPNLTTNGLSLPESVDYSKLGVISFSFDIYKVKRVTLRKLVSNIKKAKSYGVKVGLSYLLLDRESLYRVVSAYLYFEHLIDYFYVLQLKYHRTEYSTKELKDILVPFSLLLNGRVLLDDSIHLRLGLKNRCSRGNEMIALFSDGSVSGCSFDKPISCIDKPSDLAEVVESYYPMKETLTCPFVYLSI